MAYVRTVKTSSGATAVQIVWSWRKGSRSIEHLGSAHDDVELAALKAAAAERLAAGQTELDLGISGHLEPGTLPILSSQMTSLWETLCVAYRALGFESAAKSDNVFRDLVLARIIEPTSKIDAERVLTEVGLSPASYATVKRHLPCYAKPGWRQALAAVSAAHAKARGGMFAQPGEGSGDRPHPVLCVAGRTSEQRHQDETGKRCKLELDQGDEELHGQDEECDQDYKPGDQQHEDLDKVFEERHEAHQLAGRLQDRLAGVDADLCQPPGLQELVCRKA